jgi:hypothetical protein
MRGADGEKIAVFRKGRASLEFNWAAAHAHVGPLSYIKLIPIDNM